MADGPPPRKRVKFDYQKTFDVLVGPKKAQFTLYHDLFTQRSEFFRAARSPRWWHDPKKPTDLTDHDPETFTDYLNCVYSNAVALSTPHLNEWLAAENDIEASKPKAVKEEIHDIFEDCIKLYVLADKIEDLTAANLVIDELVSFSDKAHRLPSIPTYNMIYDTTTASSPLRVLARDWLMQEASLTTFGVEEDDNYPVELLKDFAREYIRTKKEHDQKKISEVYDLWVSDFKKCRYHQHSDNHPKCEVEDNLD